MPALKCSKNDQIRHSSSCHPEWMNWQLRLLTAQKGSDLLMQNTRHPGSSLALNSNLNLIRSLDLNNLQELQGTDGEGSGTPLQYSCLENPMDGAW